MKRKTQALIKKIGEAIVVILLVSFICFSIVGIIPIKNSIGRRFGLHGFPGESDDYLILYNKFGFEMGLLWEDGSEINFFIRYFQWLGFARDNTGNFSGLLQGDLGNSWRSELNLNDFLPPKILFTLVFSMLFFIFYFSIDYLYCSYNLLTMNSKFQQFKKKTFRKLVIIPTLLMGLLIERLAWKVFDLEYEFDNKLQIESFILDKNFYLFMIFPFLVVTFWSLLFSTRNISINEEVIIPFVYREYLWNFGYTKDKLVKIYTRNIITFQLHYTRDNLSMFYSVIMIIECLFNLPGLTNNFLVFSKHMDLSSLLSSIFVFSLMLIIHRLFLDIILVFIDPGVLEGKPKFQLGTLKTKWIMQF